MKELLDIVYELISLKELNLLAVLCDPINHSHKDKIIEVAVKKSNTKDSKTVVKVSIVNE